MDDVVWREISESEITERRKELAPLRAKMDEMSLSSDERTYIHVAVDFELHKKFESPEAFISACLEAFEKGLDISGDGFDEGCHGLEPSF